MIITKGDLYEQEGKIERAGVGQYFDFVEIVSDKSRSSYTRILERYRIPPERFMMVGNSLRSDILLVLELGARALYIPADTTWSHEMKDPPAPGAAGFYQLGNLGELPDLLDGLPSFPS